MNEQAFFIKLILSFIVGSIWTTFTSIAAERFGSKVGGFIGGLPTTAVVAFFFIGLTQSIQTVTQATTVFPLIYSFSGLFVVFYAIFSKKGFALSMFGSLLIWFTLSGIVVLLKLENFLFSLLFYVTILLLSLYFFEIKMKLPSTEKMNISYTPFQIAGRAIFSGSIIAFAVFMTKIGGPIFGGIFSAFPAVFISVLTITHKSKGMSFSRTMTKPLFVTGMVTIVIYGVSVRYCYPHFGLILGTACAYFISMISAYITYFFIQNKLL